MKKTSTYLSKYASGIIIVVAMLANSFSASAEEYKSMIRYDRVWEHIAFQWNHRWAYYVRFTGTEEINGKTYHRLEAFKEVEYTYNHDAQPDILGIDNGYYQHEGYLREEDGKVYTLIVRDNSEKEYASLYLYTPDKYEDIDSCTIEEKLLYDFTCSIGDTYRGLHIDGEAMEIDYKVNSIEHVEIDGEDHRLLYVSAYNEWSNGWNYNEPIVEGIGITEYGCLTTINFLSIPSCPCMNHIFNRVLGMDGQVLYCSETGSSDVPIDFSRVDAIEESEEDAAPCYDILGRRIAEPASGQLYIRGGRKHIAR